MEAAAAAGMKYAVLTVKHADGYCLWDSKHTTHDIASREVSSSTASLGPSNRHFPPSSFRLGDDRQVGLRLLLHHGHGGQEGLGRQSGPTQWPSQGPPAESKIPQFRSPPEKNFRKSVSFFLETPCDGETDQKFLEFHRLFPTHTTTHKP
jgi:hypothetical protein